MFHDETMPSFFRRPSYSPDGSLLIVPGELSLLNNKQCKIINFDFMCTETSTVDKYPWLSQHSVASWLIFYQCIWVGHRSANCWLSVNHHIDRVSTTYRSGNQTRLSTDTRPWMPLIWFYYNQHFVTLILTSLIFILDWQLADLMLVIRWLMPLMFSPVLLLTSECPAECWH